MLLKQSSGEVLEKDKFIAGQYICGRNKFETLNSSISDEPEKVITLGLVDCGVRAIEPGAFAALKNCKRIVLYDNHLTEINKNDFVGLTKLEAIFFKQNKIEKVECEAFNLPSLKGISWIVHILMSFLKLSIRCNIDF